MKLVPHSLRAGAVALSAMALLTSCATSEDSKGDQEQGTDARRGSVAEFSSLLSGGVKYDYEPAEDPADLADESALVVRGSVLEFREGRTELIDDVSGFTDVSVVAVVAVSEVLEGQLATGSNDLVYVELVRSGETSADDYTAALPSDNEVVLYLVPSRPGAETIQDPAAGRPAGQPIMAPFNPQGFWMSDGSGSTAVMDGEESADPIEDALPDSPAFPE